MISQMINVDALKSQLKELYSANKDITIFYPGYERFASDLRCFIYENYFENTPEWRIISQNLIYRSNQYLAVHEVDIIMVELEKLHRRLLKEENEDFWSYIHPGIALVSQQKLYDGHFADSVESAFKEINSRIKKIYRKERGEEKDGSKLMAATFSLENPVLKFEELDTESGKNVQNGYLQIFQGAITGIRNPAAHENQSITREDAIKKLIFASLLMDKVDDAVAYCKIVE